MNIILNIKKNSLFLAQLGIIIFGLAVLVAMIRLPLTEGRAVSLNLFQIYTDPFILYGYAGSIPFFYALFKGFTLLGYIKNKTLFSVVAISTINRIKYAAFLVCLMVVSAALFIIIFHNKDDDPAGFIMLCLLTVFLTILVVMLATVFEKKIRKALATQNQTTV